jgi:hypothetical protein
MPYKFNPYTNNFDYYETVSSTTLGDFAPTTSAELAGVITDETGTGALVFGTSPTFTTQITAPIVIGGTSTTSTLTYKTTTGVGTTGADHIFQVGNNGATEAMRILNNGRVGIGVAAPLSPLHVNGDIAAVNANPVIFLGPSNGSPTTVLYHSIGYAQSSGFHIASATAGDMTIAARPTGGILFGTNSSAAQPQPRMFITNAGRVGIGTVTPGMRLHVLDSAAVESRVESTGSTATLSLRSQSSDFAMVTTGGSTSLTGGTGDTMNIILNGSGQTNQVNAAHTGGVGIGVGSPTAFLHIKAGTTAASSAPLKFTSGSLQTTAEAGAHEFLTDDYYLTITTGAARKKIVLAEISGAARMPQTGAALVTGNATLVAGTVTVNTTAATTNAKILLSRKTSGGTPGNILTYTISAGTSFTITSSSGTDTSEITYLIIEGF